MTQGSLYKEERKNFLKGILAALGLFTVVSCGSATSNALSYSEYTAAEMGAEVTIEADSEEEALAKAEECFADRNFDVIVDDYSIEDYGDLYGSAYIE